MEALAPLALAAAGLVASNGMKVSSGGRESKVAVPKIGRSSAPPAAHEFPMAAQNDGMAPTDALAYDPVRSHYEANAVPFRNDNLQPLRTVIRDPKYALTPESGQEFDYDRQNAGNSHLENQWYYSGITKDEETPLSMGYLPQYTRTTGVLLRDPDSPDILKPKKRELLDEEVWVAQPERDRKHYDPLQFDQSKRAFNESKTMGASGALDGYYMNDSPGNPGGAWKGWSTGLEPTRRWTGHHPMQRFFRKHDNKRQRNPHGLRAGLMGGAQYQNRSELQGQYTNMKKDQLSNYRQIAVADGGRGEPHLPNGMRKVDLRYVQREGPPMPVGQGLDRGREVQYPVPRPNPRVMP